MKSILFYVSGHGFGHARRMTQVMLALRERRPDYSITVRTAAPPRVFDPLPQSLIEPCDIDAGLSEIDPLTIDRPRSLARVLAFMERRDAIAAAEVAAVQRIAPAMIVADIPFLAAEVARQTGVPCVGISNFTWDWIYEALFQDEAAYAAIAPLIRRAHAKFTALLELPLGMTSPAIATKIAMPLISMKSRRRSADILQRLRIAADDRRLRVLFGTRGALGLATLARAAAGAPRWHFLCAADPSVALPQNATGFALGRDLDFSDVLAISDVVVSKLGYGIISECIATQKPMIWPPRVGFAEDRIVADIAPRHMPLLPMPRDAFEAGDWLPYLDRAMNLLPETGEPMPTDGAEACASWLIDAIERRP